MDYEETFELNRKHIRTTFTSVEKEIETHISSFLHLSNRNNIRTKVIGFDAEWYIVTGSYIQSQGIFAKSEFATIHL